MNVELLVLLAMFAIGAIFGWESAYRLGRKAGDEARALVDRHEVERAAVAQFRAEARAEMWERRALMLLQVVGGRAGDP